MVPGNGPNGTVPEHFEVPGSLTCSITGSESKQVPLLSKGTVVDGKLETRDFGDFRVTGTKNSFAVAAIKSDKLQAFRSFLSKPATAKPAQTTLPSATSPLAGAISSATSTALTPWIKLPVGVPKEAHGPVKIPFALRYEDIKIGTGPVGEAGKLWHIKYTGWRAADGVKFDSWDEHGKPVLGPDGKPELGPDGKPKLGDAQPLAIPQGMGRVIPGFDYGLEGMNVGGKRRIFIPWEMAYGTRAIPDRPDHPGIPAKSDLIFDVELVEVTDMPAPQRATMPAQHPGVPPNPGASPQPKAAPAAPAPATAPNQSQPK